MPQLAVFHGDADAAYALMVAIEHNCTCERDDVGRVRGNCGAHRALLDQRFSDGVIWVRWLLPRLLQEEWLMERTSKSDADGSD